MKRILYVTGLAAILLVAASRPAAAQLPNRTDQFNLVLPKVSTTSTEHAVITLRNPNTNASVPYYTIHSTLNGRGSLCASPIGTDEFAGFLAQTCPPPGPTTGTIGPGRIHQITVKLSPSAPIFLTISYAGAGVGAHLQGELTYFSNDPQTAPEARILAHSSLMRDEDR